MFLFIILGMAIYGVALPIVGTLVDLVCSCLRFIQNKIEIRMQKDTDEMLGQQEPCATHAIGFQIPQTKEEYYDE